MPAKSPSFIVVASLVLLIACSGLTAAASAQGPAIDQYVESLPDSGGDRPSNSGDGGGSGSGGSTPSGTSTGTSGTGTVTDAVAAPSVPPAKLSELRSTGTDGGAAANAIEAISGASSGSSPGANGSGLIAPVDSADGDTPLAGVISMLTGGGPGGFALPAILITVLAGGLLLAVRSRGSAG